MIFPLKKGQFAPCHCFPVTIFPLVFDGLTTIVTLYYCGEFPTEEIPEPRAGTTP